MISFLYSIAIIVIIAAYFPQIWTLLRARTRCSDISLLTWFTWEATSIISLLYVTFEVYDLKLIIVYSACSTCNAAIIAITLYKRKKYVGVEE